MTSPLTNAGKGLEDSPGLGQRAGDQTSLDPDAWPSGWPYRTVTDVWFAWRPVALAGGGWRWLTNVTRYEQFARCGDHLFSIRRAYAVLS